jgi:AmmeMemoRadiSam system protein B
MIRTRSPAVAGTFYPADREQLAGMLAHWLDAAGHDASPAPKALIAPHAGYIYSGPVAALAYARITALRSRVTRVVLAGPAHRVAINGLALPGTDAFATPLGTVPLDHDAVAAIADLPQITVSAAAHAWEHSLEVHLPFLQTMLDRFTLVPLVVGDAEPSAVEEVFDRLWGGPETLIVVSSDLSHYLSYRTAQTVDHETAQAILELHAGITHQQACGATPANALLHAARRRGLAPALVDLRNSGDTAGDKTRVVGYGSFTFTEASANEH